VALFGRAVTVEFGQEGTPGLRHTGLRVSFSVQADRTPEPNTATIEIYNLNEASLDLLEGPRGLVRLLVGYGDELGTPPIPRLAFQGNPVRGGVVTRKQGPDRITTIEASDGGRAYQLRAVDIVHATPVSASAVVAQIAAQLGLPLGAPIAPATDIQMTQGVLFSGPARQILDRLARSTGSRWMIVDGLFFFVARSVPIPGAAPLLSSTKGNLLGAPAKKRDGKIEVRALMDTALRPGRPFVVESTDINGVFVATAVQFRGDSGYEPPFEAVVTGIRRT